jgi:hypothetical protein
LLTSFEEKPKVAAIVLVDNMMPDTRRETTERANISGTGAGVLKGELG